ncbi:DUF349 domain-containing protein [Marinoscillum sp. MHG1-6]|uniref:DUF349 domain-containing protein n=1 Tax=Marinoscillum sp. MHG1-6 TaxID=2959627 RepID=UPI0021589047|nr:DUF349 domain-containing protein [Marinoscillum sp. MHG1-6]
MVDKDEKLPDSDDKNQVSDQVSPESSKEEGTVEKKEEPAASTEPKEEVEDLARPEASAEDDSEADDKEEESGDGLLENLNLDGADKKKIYAALKQFSSIEDMRLVDRALKEIKPYYDKIYQAERQAALEAFTAQEGNDEADFQFKGDELDSHFFLLYNTLREKKQKYFSQLNKDREQNLVKKNVILDRIRELVDGEETNVSIEEIKALQSEWKSIGQVPSQYNKTLWANYHALLDRFYDNRSIYFELKELDRKKNLEGKLELCEKAEALDELENIKEAIHQLNELHEEFKHIGPIPREEQDAVWDRFKAASDKIYSKRKDFFDHVKEELSHNAKEKYALGDEAEKFASFNSDRIGDWNKKTKQILELQKKWDKIGGLPRDRAKEINRHFWSNFKKFFSNKSDFFKKLESEREVNLEKKLELVKQAEVLKDSTDWNQTANELKKLQQDWRKIGPVPEKRRNDVYEKFKTACDAFFDRKRSQSSGEAQEYELNLKKKNEICAMLEAYLNSDEIELNQVYDLIDRYAEIGFVPRNAIEDIHHRFDEVMERLLNMEELSDNQRNELELKIQVNKLKNSPHSTQKINRKEGSIKKKISDLESEISTWKTNMEFFADSETADQLKEELMGKVDEAEKEIEDLRRQLQVFKQL